MRRLLLSLLFCCSCAGCPVNPTPSQDAAQHVSCVTVCQRGEVLGCKWAAPTPLGTPCADVCANAEAFGLRWDLACRTNAQTCAAVDSCP